MSFTWNPATICRYIRKGTGDKCDEEVGYKMLKKVILLIYRVLYGYTIEIMIIRFSILHQILKAYEEKIGKEWHRQSFGWRFAFVCAWYKQKNSSHNEGKSYLHECKKCI